MTEKQRRFAEEYLIDANGTRAYLKVYKNCKSTKTAGTRASLLLKDEEIKDYINEKLKGMSNKRIAEAEEVMAYLTKVMRGEETEEIAINKGKGCQEITSKKPNMKDRIKAAELLAKRYNIGDEKEVDAPIIIKEDLDG